MFTAEWEKPTGWTAPRISPLEPLRIHPAAKVLHYAIEVPNCFVLFIETLDEIYLIAFNFIKKMSSYSKE